MPRFDHVQKASFNGLPFNIDTIEVRGSGRYYVHKYPHADGGSVETLGRELYMIRMHVSADEGIKQYPGFYPDGVATMRSYGENQISANLVVPSTGSIQAILVDWPQKWTAASRSGESIDYEFIEDMQADSLDVFTLASSSITSLTQQANALPNIVKDAIPASLLDQIITEINAFIAMKNEFQSKAEIASILLESRVLSVTSLIDQGDRLIQDPLRWPALEALKDAAFATVQAANDLRSIGARLREYTVPRTTSIGEISMKLYGTAERGMELLQINPIDDAFAVPCNTVIRYYAAA